MLEVIDAVIRVCLPPEMGLVNCIEIVDVCRIK
jgi:hypothetical protein